MGPQEGKRKCSAYSSSSLRTAINASVGSCTVPKVRIFFLPAQTGLGPFGYPGMISMLGRSEFAISALRAALRAVALRNASLRLGVRQGFCLRQKRLYGAMRRPTLWGGGLSSEVQRFVKKEFKRRFPAQAFARATI